MKKTKTWNRVLDFCPQKKKLFSIVPVPDIIGLS